MTAEPKVIGGHEWAGRNVHDGTLSWLPGDASCQLGTQVGLLTREPTHGHSCDLGFSWYDTWVPRERSILTASISRDPSRGCNVSYDLASEVLQYHFHQIVLVNRELQAQ